MAILMVFATMTCNPNWHEKQENLKDGETLLDRPDLFVHVFELKKQQLIRDLGVEMSFGKMIAGAHSIEFHKRWFPHMYIIFCLEEGSHMTPKESDKFICAELPDKYLSEKDHTGMPMVDGEGKPLHKHDENDKKVINPLWTAVISFMLHGPCGQYSRLNEVHSLLSLSLIAKISLHKLYCASEFLNTTHGTPNRGNEKKKQVLSEDHTPETTDQLYSIHPTQIELYSLQLLLSHVKGSQCYKDT